MPGGPASILTAEEDAPQDWLRHSVVVLGQLADEVMHVSIPQELERQHRSVLVDVLPLIRRCSEISALGGHDFTFPVAHLDDMPGPLERLVQCLLVSKGT